MDTSKSPSVETHGKRSSLVKSMDDMRKHISKLKAELDASRAKNRKLQKDQGVELEKLRLQIEDEKAKEIDKISLKLLSEKHTQLAKLRETLTQEKDLELRQVLRLKDDEIVKLKDQFETEKEEAIDIAIDLYKNQSSHEHHVTTQANHQANAMQLEQLQLELRDLRNQKSDIEKQYKLKCVADNEKATEIRKMTKEHELEINRIIRESKRESIREMKQLKDTEKALAAKDQQLRRKSLTEELGEKLSFIDRRNPRSSTPLSGRSRSSSIEALDQEASFTSKKPEDRELEQRKIRELNTQLSRLEKRISGLRAENEALKRKEDETKPAEEKIKKLKKRNAELASIARRLEEKAKQLQQDSIRRPKEGNSQDADHVKKVFARQRAKDLAEHAKNILAKDKEIEDLKDQCQNLTEELSNKSNHLENGHVYEEKSELESIIKQAAKERLRLERQVQLLPPSRRASLNVSLEKTHNEDDVTKIHLLEEKNQTLQSDISKLESSIEEKVVLQLDLERVKSRLHQLEKYELEATRKRVECESLKTEIENQKTKCAKLEFKSQQTIEESRKTQNELEAQRTKCLEIEKELGNAALANQELTSQNADLSEKIQELEKVTEESHDLKLNLLEAQTECQAARSEIDLLKSKIDNLEAVIKHMRETAEKHRSLEQDHQVAVEQLKVKQEEIKMLQKTQVETRRENEEVISTLQAKLRELERKYELQAIKHEELTLEMTVIKQQTERAKNVKNSKSVSSIEIQTDDDVFLPDKKQPRLMNGISSFDSGEKQPIKIHDTKQDTINRNSSNHNDTLDDIIGFNEDDTQSLHENLDDLLGSLNSNDDSAPGLSSLIDGASPVEDSELHSIVRKLNVLTLSDEESETLGFGGKEPSSRKEKYSRKMADSGSEADSIRDEVTAPSKTGTSSTNQHKRPKSPFELYVARYSYDPFQFSPNENPEAELSLNAGDYVYIMGEMDEDGFFEGELVDGQHGLVPSNFVTKVPDEEVEAILATLGQHTSSNSSLSNSLQHDLEFNSSDESERLAQQQEVSIKPAMVIIDDSDLEDIEEVDEDNLTTDRSDITSNSETKHKGVPYPRNLKLERQLNNSIVISWNHPETSPHVITAYHVYVDDTFKTSVKSSERTKALVEGVTSTKPHKICVRSVTNRGQSKDPECTINIGKESSLAPSNLRVRNVTATSALLSWLPGNSNYVHTIYVNNAETRICKPGIYKHSLSGLTPDTAHKVKVQAKNAKATYDEGKDRKRSEQLSSTIEFRTEPGSIPDPPLDVQVEPGPQEGTLLVTWLPITINAKGFSNGAIVTGYSVYADGTKIKDINSPTDDHTVLQSDDFAGQKPKEIYMCTQSRDGASENSSKVTITQDLIKEITKNNARNLANAAAAIVKEKLASTMYEDLSDEDDTENLTNSADSDEPEEVETFEKSSKKTKPSVKTVNEDSLYSEIAHASKDSKKKNSTAPKETQSSSTKLNKSAELSNPTDLSKPAELSKPTDLSSPTVLSNQIADLHIKSGTDSTSSELSDIEEVEEDVDFSSDFDVSIPGMSDEDNPVAPSVQQNMRHTSEETSSPKSHSKHPHPLKTSSPKSSQSASQKSSAPESPRSRSRSGSGSKSRDSPRRSKNDSSKSLTPRTVDGSPKLEETGFKPVVSPTSDRSPITEETQSPQKTEEDLSPIKTGAHKANMPVPHIEITKDTSGSRTTTNEYSDDDFDSYSNTDSRISNMNSSRDSHGVSSGVSPRGRGNQQTDKYQPEMDSRDGYRDTDPNPSQQSQNPKSPNWDQDSKRGSSHYSNQSNNMDTSSGKTKSRKMGIVQNMDVQDSLEYDEDSYESDIDFTEGEVRIFIALFDYDPKSMSPNAEECEDELPFKEGQLIKIFGEKDPDGFYRGESKGCRGYVPCNMVSEVEPELAKQLLNENIEIGGYDEKSPGMGNNRGYKDGAINNQRYDNTRSNHDDARYNDPSYHGNRQSKERGSKDSPVVSPRGHRDSPRGQQREGQYHPRGAPNRGPMDSPTRHVDSPSHRRDSPNRNLDSPSRHRDRHPDEPLRQQSHRDSPSRNIDSPDRYRDSPNRHRDSPNRHRDSPNRHQDSPNRHRDSPSHHRDGQTRHRDSPSRNLDSPSRHRDSPSSRHRDRDSSNRYRDGSGTRHRDSPSRQVYSPDSERSMGSNRQYKDHSRDPSRERSYNKSPYKDSPRDRNQNGIPPIPTEDPPRKMIALYDYDPQELSPNVDAEVELSFRAGEHILVFGEMDEDGFFMGEMKGQRGLVPSNFLEELPPSEEDLDVGSGFSSSRSRDSMPIISAPMTEKLEADPQRIIEPMMPMDLTPAPSPKKSKKSTKKDKTSTSPAHSINADSNDKKDKKKGFFSMKGKSFFKKLKK